MAKNPPDKKSASPQNDPRSLDKKPDSEKDSDIKFGPNANEYAQVLDTIPESTPQPKKDSFGEFLFQVFCAVIFLGMIGLVFYNTMLRYVLGSSYPPSEEWSRFLFIYITFFGAIEAFYRKKHIAVDMFVDLLHGAGRKTIDILATLMGMAAMFLLLWGGIVNVMETYDTYSVATNVNITFIYGTLPIMAAAAFAMQIYDLCVLIGRPAHTFKKGAQGG